MPSSTVSGRRAHSTYSSTSSAGAGASDKSMLFHVTATICRRRRSSAWTRWRGRSRRVHVACRIKKVYPYGQWPPALDQARYDVYEEATGAHEHGGVPQPASVSPALRALFDVAKRNRAWDSSLARVLRGPT
jgi:hypothetical protein